MGLAVCKTVVKAVEVRVLSYAPWESGSDVGTNRSFLNIMEKYIQKECIHHGQTTFVLEGRGSYRCLTCRRKSVQDRRRKVKEILVREHGGKCQICGYDKYIGALDFHHLDRKDKEFALSHKGSTRGLNKMREEAQKCLLVCTNCHREIEAGLVKIPD